MALRLGLEFAGDPRWYYRLSRAEQVDVMAFDRLRNVARERALERARGGGG